MNVLKLNNEEFQVESFSRVTNFLGETISSTASCTLLNINNTTSLNTLAQAPITTLQIIVDDNIIYNLQNINAQITSINETLMGDRMSIYLNLIFN